jgi:steroid 5-alpha reductase family enzyme
MTADFTFVALAGLLVVMLAMTALWGLSLRLRDASIADPFWGPGFALAATTYVWADGRFGARGMLALLLVTLWAVRLGNHLMARNRSEGEDPRYRAMRARHGDRFGRVSLFTVFWLQAVLLWMISAPILGSVRSDTPLGLWDGFGTMVVLVGLVVESFADRQLAAFRTDPANEGLVLSTGLWRYSRHPNYFGDAVVWWGLYLIAVAGGAYWSAVGPALITFLLLRVSGVPMLEEGLRSSRPGYVDYVRRTSAFVPWFPKE